MEWFALIAGLAGLIGSLVVSSSNRASTTETNETNLQSVRETNATNERLAAESNQWQSEEWLRQFNMTNEYNLPVNQMARLRAAGLNPALASTNGSLVDAEASQGSTPSANLASAQPFHAIAPMMSGLETSQLADSALKMAQARNLDADTDTKTINNLTLDKRNSLELQRIKADTDQALQYTKNLVANEIFTKNEDARQGISTYQSVLESQSRIAELGSRVALQDAQKDKTDAETSFIQEQQEWYGKKMVADLTVAYAQAEKLVADKNYIKECTRMVQQQVAAGSYELASEYGSTPEEIENTVKQRFALAASELHNDKMKSELNDLQNSIDKKMMPFDNFIDRISKVTSAVGNVYSIGFNRGSYSSRSHSTNMTVSASGTTQISPKRYNGALQYMSNQ